MQTVSPGSASTPPDNSAQIQVRQARSEPLAGSRRDDSGVAMIPQISLEVPARLTLRAMIKEQVLINVTVGVDQREEVTTAEVASAKGEEADLLTTEALKAARWFRFRPNRQGNKPVARQTNLTFVFTPDPGGLRRFITRELGLTRHSPMHS